MPKYVGALDQGTTSTRFMIFDHGGQVVAIHQKEHEQIYPKPGWVEHDPAEIWARSQEVIRGALDKAGITAADLAAVGITNQRETAVVWDKNTGKAVYNAIVWQDTRTDVIVNELAKDGGQDRLRAKTGLPLATYFSGPKVKWILDNVDGARAKADAGDLLFGNIDTWCIWNLTGGPNGGVHVTDVTNASRTLLINLRDAVVGRRAHVAARHPEVDAPRRSGLVRGLRHGQGRPRGHPGRGRPGRPAGRPLRAGLLRRRRGEEHLRHRLLHAPQHGHEGGPVEERPAHDARLQDRRPARGLRARGLDRDHRRARPVAARQPRADHVLGRGRGAGRDRRGQRRRLLRAGVLRPVRAVLEERRPWRDRRPHPLRQQGPHRPRHARGDRLADPRGARRDERRLRRRR